MAIDPCTDHIKAFAEAGYAGPIRLMTADAANALARRLLCASGVCPVWDKSLAAVDPAAFQVAADPLLVGILRTLLGNDLILWGASIIIRRPRESHPWHCDIESCAPGGGFASVWLGLINTRPETSLKLVPGSHRYGVSFQELCTRKSIARTDRDDETALKLARSQREEAELLQLSVADGEAILFDGRLWHASANSLHDTQRTSLLLQFARADIPLRVPNYDEPQWPFRLKDHVRPPVIAISGIADPIANDVVPPPSTVAELALKPSAHLIDTNLRCREGAPCEAFPCFFGHTEIVDFVECHTSVLMPGHSPHPPHAHLDEEILVVMNGAAELVVPSSPDDENPSIFAAPEGSAIYYPSYQLHTIRNASDKPVRYTMIKWKSTLAASGKKLAAQFLQSSWVDNKRPRPPLSMTPLYEGSTGFLGKLHAHISRLQPGTGYAAHRDDHDVAIFLIRGEIVIMGKRIIAPAIVFLPAGSLHDMKACGAETAKYLVWEFHRPQQESADARLAEASA